MKKIVQVAAQRAILFANITENIWWILQTLIVKNEIISLIFYINIPCIFLRILQQILIDKKIGQFSVLHIISLFYYMLQVEAFLLLQYENIFGAFSNCLLIILTYHEYLKIAVQKWSIICKFGFPCYIVLRITSNLFKSFNMFDLESLIIISVIIFHILFRQENDVKKIPQAESSKSIIKHNNEFKYKFPDLENESPKIFNQHKSLSKSQSRASILLTPLKSQSILLKEATSESKMLHISNLTVNQKHQKNLSVCKPSEKSDLQLHLFYQNMINIFPSGILILNQFQQVSYMNNKCEKLLECSGVEAVLDQIKNCINNAKMPENDSEISNLLWSRNNKQLNQYTLQRIIKYLEKEKANVDILDILLFPQKYFTNLDQKFEFERYSQDESKTDQLTFQQSVFIYEWLLETQIKQKLRQKKLKLIIIPTQITSQQQEFISCPSQQRCNSKINLQFIGETEVPILLVMIKNVTKKHQYQQMKNEQIIHHSLIKSFSHELRTPLNSCQHMLNLIKNNKTEKNINQYVDIAQCSITLLIHQINDILDYAAIQSFQFQYHLGTFTINQIIQEIESLYQLQMQQKQIDFKIKAQQNLLDSLIYNDKQRILQTIVNLLNNACKYTKEGGQIRLSIKQKSLFILNFKITDTGIGIEDNKLLLIKNSLIGAIELGARLKTQQMNKIAGLGLNIAAKIVSGLTENNNNQLQITSIKNQGTKVQFLVQNFFQNLYEPQQSGNMLSQLTGRFNNTGIQQTLSERRFDDRMLVRSRDSNSRQEHDLNIQGSLDSESSVESPKLNDYKIQPQITLPVSPEYFTHNSLSSIKQIQTKNAFGLQQFSQICPNCVHVLIVDDIPFNQMALKLMLKNYHFEADQAFDGFQAIEKVQLKSQQHCSFYALILMDIEMPGINGFQTSKQILEITGRLTTIVICSAYDTQENVIEGQKVGITTFLPKPINQHDLETVLRNVFQCKISSI